jgi:hypothetical protein
MQEQLPRHEEIKLRVLRVFVVICFFSFMDRPVIKQLRKILPIPSS